MTDITYYGELLWPGQLGHLAILASFVFALLTAFAYAKSEKKAQDHQWLRLGRIAFSIHGIMTFMVIGLLFYIMLNKHYEYQYAWAHVSDDLAFKYMFSAFWEDQAGSFLLWAFWHILLGWVLIKVSGKWEAPVMVSLSFAQAFIVSMLLGIYLIPGSDAIKLGFNPFVLLRETMDAPIFANADYLKLITGKGLNPLLQNYWMTIHPPTLFLGFASTTIPFCFAIAALWRRDYRSWLKPVLPWALFSGSILGIGILMGAAWAYEALSFGGYWAWDPVENMSLVPWLILIAGIHTNLVAKQNGHSIRATLIFYGFSFLLVLFSTFLTRSGVLQDSSVHAFTEMGLEWQLVAFIVFFSVWFLWQFFRQYASIEVKQEEESVSSREFWMFIGSLVLLFSAILITFTTSIPVYNKIADLLGWMISQDMSEFHRSMPLDPIEHYNRYQFWIALFIAILSGFGQYLRYNISPSKDKWKSLGIRLGLILLGSACFTWLTWYWLQYSGWAFHFLVGSAWFTVIANTDYLISFIRGNLCSGASTLSHIGFGLMVIGIVASGVNKQHISQNRFAMEGILSEDIVNKNVLLFKEAPLLINGYKVTYLSDTLVGLIRTYEIKYERLGERGEILDSFRLYPNIQFDKDFQKQAASNPSTKRYWAKDIFSHIAGLPPEHGDAERAKAKEDSLKYKSWFMMPGKSVQSDRLKLTLDSWSSSAQHPDYVPELNDIVVSAHITVQETESDTSYSLSPFIVLRENLVYSYPDKNDPVEVKVRLNDGLFTGYLVLDSLLNYETIQLLQGETRTISGTSIKLEGFDKEPVHPQYVKEGEDIAVAARLRIADADQPDFSEVQEPVFLIRQGQTYNIKTFSPSSGIHIRFIKLDPNDGRITLLVAKQPGFEGMPVEIAENYKREDYIVLEAIIFPGINFFWLGSLFMMIGLGLGAWYRRKEALSS